MHTSSAAPTLDIPAPGAGSRLGEILVANGAITDAQLKDAITHQARLRLPLGKVLLKLAYVTDERIKQALATQLGIPYVDVEKMVINRDLARTINRIYAKRHAIVPIARVGDTLTVAMDDPTAKSVVEDLRRLTQLTINVVTASSRGIQRGWTRLYDDPPTGRAAEVTSADVSPAPAGGATNERDITVSSRGDELFQMVLARALALGTSDVHLEMLPDGLHIRCRVDGLLRPLDLGPVQAQLDKLMREVVSRIKILSKLDIAERRRPQDGSFRVDIERGGRMASIDLRVSCIPSYSGESVVIRILDRARAPKSLDQLDLTALARERLTTILQRTSGIFLVTGPTGSGKSTTLYSCLMRLHRPEIRVLTAEDPVEYVYEQLSQSEVNETIGNSFATYLRAFLRHDPEVIMVGEIRDEETAEMAFRAAQTGHLLLSTLHTNSAIAALPRLRDLKIESSLISSSLIGVLSQRLVRRICRACRREAAAPREAGDFFGTVPAGFVFYKGAGCQACGSTGYDGRLMVADLWVPDEEDMLLITREAPFEEIRRSAERTTLSMADDAHERLRQGQTTVEELMRVLPYTAIAEHRDRVTGGR
jgi:type IV pilus assembly protein PilB